jgi:hypothetical protein
MKTHADPDRPRVGECETGVRPASTVALKMFSKAAKTSIVFEKRWDAKRPTVVKPPKRKRLLSSSNCEPAARNCRETVAIVGFEYVARNVNWFAATWGTLRPSSRPIRGEPLHARIYEEIAGREFEIISQSKYIVGFDAARPCTPEILSLTCNKRGSCTQRYIRNRIGNSRAEGHGSQVDAVAKTAY